MSCAQFSGYAASASFLFRLVHIHTRELQEVFAQDLAFRRLREVRVAVAYPQGPAAFRSPRRHRRPIAGTKWGFRSRIGSFLSELDTLNDHLVGVVRKSMQPVGG